MKRIVALSGAGLAAVATCVVLVLAVGWGESSAEAKQDFCNSLDNLATTVMNYQGLDVRTATNDELDAAGDDIYGAWDEVVNDAEDWANAYDNPLAEAYDDLYWAIQDLPGEQTVAEDLEDLEPELQAFPEAFHETFDGSGCSGA
jgi:hypothetical protein